jgi:hypothetical protein
MPAVAPVLGVLAGVCAVANTIPYIRDIVRGRTRPHRGTWLVWAVLAVVVYVSQRADGASWSLPMAGAQALLTTVIFVLAIRRGEGGLSATDALLTAMAAAGVVGWMASDEPERRHRTAHSAPPSGVGRGLVVVPKHVGQ